MGSGYFQVGLNDDRLNVLEANLESFRHVKGTTDERTAMALTLTSDDEGSVYFWDTTLKAQFIWNGTEFV